MILFHKKADGFNLQACDVICAAILFGSLTYGIKAVVSYIGFADYEENASLLFYLLWAIIYGRFLICNSKMILNFFIAEAIYGIILYANYKLFPYTRDYYEENFMFLRQIVVVYIPSLTVALTIKNFKGYLNNFSKVGKFGIAFMMVTYFMGFTERWNYQQFGINLCPFVTMILPSYLLHHRLNNLLWILVGFIFLMAGGRQSFVGFFVAFLVVYYCIKLHDIPLHKIMLYLLLSIIGVFVLYILLPFFIDILGDILKSIGMESRTLEMLTSDELFSTSTRDYIYESSLYYIKSNLFDIKGLFADRYFLRLSDDWIAYSHNMILEIILDFGVIIGGFITLIIFFQYFKQIRKAKIEKRSVIGVLATIVIIRLMVSSSFMIEGLFYTVLGLLFNPYDMLHVRKIFQ